MAPAVVMASIAAGCATRTTPFGAHSFWQANPLEGWLLCFGGEEEEKRMSDYSPFAGRCIYTVELRVRDLCEPRIFAIRDSRFED